MSRQQSLKRKPTARLIPALATAMLALAACNGDTVKSASNSYKIMVIAPLSTGGTEATQPFSEIKVGADAAARVINAAGGLNGRKIEIDACDSQGNPNIAVACSRKAVSKRLPAVVGAFDTVGDYLTPLEAARVPAIAPVAISAENTSKAAYPVLSGLRGFAGSFALLANLGIKDVAFVEHVTNPAGVAPILKVAREVFGLKITEIPVETNVADFSPVAAKASQHEAVVTALFSNQAIPFVQGLHASGYQGKIVGDTITFDSDALRKLGRAAEGMYLTGYFLPPAYTQDPAVKTYADAVKMVTPNAKNDDMAENAYVAVQIFAAAAKGLPKVTASALKAKLDSSRDVNIALLPNIDFTRPSPSAAKVFPTLTRLFVSGVVFDQVKGGVTRPLSLTFHDAFSR